MPRTGFTFHEDPGHGWLEVPEEVSKYVGIYPAEYSPYSYFKSQDGRKILFLEEDLDAGMFIKAWEAQTGKNIKDHITIRYNENTPIRSYQGLPGTLYRSDRPIFIPKPKG